MPTTHLTFLVATLAISGVPFFSGFFSKDQILAGAYLGPLGQPWIYWLATLTAGMTSFYMFRGLFMTFYGESRLDHELEHHAHESSSKMTVPLIILAVFSVIAGYVGLPHPLEGLSNFLGPVFGPAQQLLKSAFPASGGGELGEITLMGFSLGAAGLGIVLAWWLYLKSPQTPARIAASLHGLYELLVHKYYVDEIYNAIIVRPIRVGSERVLWQAIDDGLIDGAGVNGTAARTMDVGDILRRIQSGNLRSYAAWVLLGAVAWLGYIFFVH
jgi:NADH-quinone oxidoreductase subunit L